jgi:hypothetical protein
MRSCSRGRRQLAPDPVNLRSECRGARIDSGAPATGRREPTSLVDLFAILDAEDTGLAAASSSAWPPTRRRGSRDFASWRPVTFLPTGRVKRLVSLKESTLRIGEPLTVVSGGTSAVTEFC